MTSAHRCDEISLLELIGHLVELENAMTRRRVRVGRRHFCEALEIVRAALNEVRRRP